MALKNVQEAVLNTARREASLVVQKAQKAAEDRKQQALQSAQLEMDQEFARQTRQIQEELSQKLLKQQAEVRRQVLEKQNVTLERVFGLVRDQLLQWPAARQADVMARLLASAAENAAGSLRIHPGDLPVFEAALAKVNHERPEPLTLDMEHPLDLPGGFVFVAADYEVDCTLDSLLQALRHDCAPRAAAKLFSSGGA